MGGTAWEDSREKIHRGLWYGRVRTDQGLGVAELVVAALLEDLRGGRGRDDGQAS